MSEFLFTSESVSEGHPDKVADQISDAVLDAILLHDPTGRVAAETLVSTGLVVMAGEITTSANVDYGRVARETIRSIGYNDPALRFDADVRMFRALSPAPADSSDAAASAQPAASTHPRPGSKAAPAQAASGAAPRAAGPGACDPPYFLDARGIKKFKPECL